MKELTVLLPLDNSEGSLLAMETARNLTENMKARFILLTSLDVNMRLTGYEEFDATLYERMEKIGKEIHDRAEKILAGHEIKSELVFGRPGEQIIDYIEQNPVDLIIMATQNQSTIKRFLIGSVTNYVLNHSTVPVLAIPMRGRQTEEA